MVTEEGLTGLFFHKETNGVAKETSGITKGISYVFSRGFTTNTLLLNSSGNTCRGIRLTKVTDWRC